MLCGSERIGAPLSDVQITATHFTDFQASAQVAYAFLLCRADCLPVVMQNAPELKRRSTRIGAKPTRFRPELSLVKLR